MEGSNDLFESLCASIASFLNAPYNRIEQNRWKKQYVVLRVDHVEPDYKDHGAENAILLPLFGRFLISDE